MTKTDVIEMARKAGGYDGHTSPPTDWDEGDFVISPEELQKFAALVRAQALEEAIKIIEEYHVPVGNSPAGEIACEWTLDALAEIRDAIRAMKEQPR